MILPSMCSLLALIMLLFPIEAFVTQSFHCATFRHATTPVQASLSMDMEGAENRPFLLPSTKRKLFQQQQSVVSFLPLLTDRETMRLKQIENAECCFGMPWRESIDCVSELLYMPFWEWLMQFLKENLTNLRVVSCTDHKGTLDLRFRENREKGARIVTICLASDEYRKIRMTYYDAGTKTQVFNSLWYPNSNLPVLGIDLLAFNGKKHLAVVDFQPIQEHESLHAMPYEHLLQPIRKQYPSLQGKMSARFYDEAQFFSNEMLFARFDDVQVVENELMPAFQNYVQTHVNLVKATPFIKEEHHQVLECQAAYDRYSAERDPATKMFEQMFGKEWADLFVYEFLFSMSQQQS